MPVDIEAFGVVPEFIEDVPDRKRVLAATHGHEHAISRLEHVELRNGLGGLVSAQLEKVLAAEIRIVTPDVDDRRRDTRGTSRAHPEMTERISTTASAASIVSAGTSVPSSITRWLSRLRSSRAGCRRSSGVELEFLRRVAEQDLPAGDAPSTSVPAAPRGG